MAELTEEQKIIIGVSVGVAAVVLLIIIVFICYIFYSRDRRGGRRSRNGFKEKLVVDRYERHPYPVYEKPVPPIIYDPPPPPPPPMPLPPPQPQIRYIEKVPLPRPSYRYEEWEDRAPAPSRRYYSDSRWEGDYGNNTIVVPVAEPEYVTSRTTSREPETIYLKYVDDQALLPRTNQTRRTIYSAPLRRSRSFHEIRRGPPYVGEWTRRPERMNEFNEYALRAGHDPFLWE